MPSNTSDEQKIEGSAWGKKSRWLVTFRLGVAKKLKILTNSRPNRDQTDEELDPYVDMFLQN